MNARSKASERQQRPAETGRPGLRPRTLSPRLLTDVSPRRASLTRTQAEAAGAAGFGAKAHRKVPGLSESPRRDPQAVRKTRGRGRLHADAAVPEALGSETGVLFEANLAGDLRCNRRTPQLGGPRRPVPSLRSQKRIEKDVPQDAPPLTRKFETYLRSQEETRTQFAERLCVTAPWLSHVFPLNPHAVPRRLGIDAALRFCKGTGGYLTLADFHEAGLCPAVEEVIRHCGRPSAEARPGDPDLRASNDEPPEPAPGQYTTRRVLKRIARREPHLAERRTRSAGRP